MIFRDSVKRGICSIPSLFIYPSTSASVSWIYILQQEGKDDKTIQKNIRERESKQKPFLYLLKEIAIWSGLSGRLKSSQFGYNLVVMICTIAKEK